MHFALIEPVDVAGAILLKMTTTKTAGQTSTTSATVVIAVVVTIVIVIVIVIVSVAAAESGALALLILRKVERSTIFFRCHITSSVHGENESIWVILINISIVLIDSILVIVEGHLSANELTIVLIVLIVLTDEIDESLVSTTVSHLVAGVLRIGTAGGEYSSCLLYTSDAADE